MALYAALHNKCQVYLLQRTIWEVPGFFCAPAHKEGSRLEPSASSLRAVPHQRSQGIGRTPLRGRINKERNKVGSSRKAGSRGTRDRQARNKREAEEDSRYRQAGSMRRALDT